MPCLDSTTTISNCMPTPLTACSLPCQLQVLEESVTPTLNCMCTPLTACSLLCQLQVLVESATNNTETERLVYRVWGSWHDLLYYFNYRWRGGGWGEALARTFWAARTGTCVKGWARLPLTPCIPWSYSVHSGKDGQQNNRDGERSALPPLQATCG